VAHVEEVGFYHMGERLGEAGHTGCTLEKEKWETQGLMVHPEGWNLESTYS